MRVVAYDDGCEFRDVDVFVGYASYVGDVHAQLQVTDAGGFDNRHGTYRAPAASLHFQPPAYTVKFGGLVAKLWAVILTS